MPISKQHPRRSSEPRPRYLGGRARLALALLAVVSGWTACAIDGREPEVIGSGGSAGQEIGMLQGSPGGSDGMSLGNARISPSAIDLGPVVVGSPARARLYIENPGVAVLAPPQVSLADDSDPAFSIIQNRCEEPLEPGQSCEIRLQVLATYTGELSGTLAVDVTGAVQDVPLDAAGYEPNGLILAPAAGSSDNFGAVRLGASVQHTFNLTNPGTIASGPLTLHVFNDDVTVVVGRPNACASGTTSLAPGETCDVHLAFGPSRRGSADAMLVATADSGAVSMPLSGRGIVAGSLGVSALSLDFDGVMLGDAGNRALRVANVGDEPLVLLGASLAGDEGGEFSIQSSDCTNGRMLTPGSSCDVTTEFRPMISGEGKSAALTVAMAAGTAETVQLLGTGLDPGSLTLVPAPDNAADFGAVLLGDERYQSFEVVNDSEQTSGPLTITASGDFALEPASQPGDCENGQTALEQIGQRCSVHVKLLPARRAAQFGSITVRSPLAKNASLRLYGIGVAPARLAVPQDEINFGRVLTGGDYQATLTVINRGDQPLVPLLPAFDDPAIAAAAGFSIESACMGPLAFDASCAVNVRFQPTQPGFPLALLRLESESGSAATRLVFGDVSVAGTLAVAVAEGQSQDFGEVGIGTTKTVQFTLSNLGAAPSGRLTITASNPEFAIDAGNCNPEGGQGLAAGESCTFNVAFTPQTAEPASSTLSIQSPGAGAAALSLTGLGRRPASVVGAGNRDFGTANLGQAAATNPSNDYTWTLTNEGDLATGALQITNTNGTEFTIAGDSCSAQVLLGRLSCEVAIRFRPTAMGARSGQLTATDATGNVTVTLEMTGNGVQIAQPGESCVNAQCATGVCTGGVCCDRACVGGCQECSDDGVCTDMVNRERCGDGSGVCFGVNRCLLPEGLSCSGDNQCGSNDCERELGGAGVNDRVCCLEDCAATGNECTPDGTSCQQPTLPAGAACGAAGQSACATGLSCKACSTGGMQCTPTNACCGACPGNQVCTNGACACPIGPNGLQMIDCGSGRCIPRVAGACCDTTSGCTGDDVCNATTNLCGCPANRPKECVAGSNICIPAAQCCNCTGPCQTCNNGTCNQVAAGTQGGCPTGQVCGGTGACGFVNGNLGQACTASVNNCVAGLFCSAQTNRCECSNNATNSIQACSGACVDTATDEANCGRCGRTCAAGSTCTAGQCQAIVVASNQTSPLRIALDANRVYWNRSSTTGVILRSVAKTGGTVTDLVCTNAQGGSPPCTGLRAASRGMVLTGTRLLFSVGGELFSIPTAGSNTVTVEDGGSAGFEDIFIDDITVQGTVTSHAISVSGDSIQLFASDEGLVGFGASEAGIHTSIAVLGQCTYMASTPGSGVGFACFLGRTVAPTYASNNPIRHIISDGTSRLFIGEDGVGVVELTPPQPGDNTSGPSTSRVLAASDGGIGALAQDAQFVYYVEAGSSFGKALNPVCPTQTRIRRVAKTGGTPATLLDSNACPGGMAVDGTFLYWTDVATSQIKKLGKTP